MNTIARRRFGALAVVGVVVAGWLFQGRPTTAAPLSLATPFEVGQLCRLWCKDEPNYCASGQHDAFISDTPIVRGLDHNGQPCWSGVCGDPDLHPWCQPEPGDTQALESLRLAVLRNDAAAVKVLLAQHASFTVNRARSAIQMTACDQVVVVHLPISASLLGAL